MKTLHTRAAHVITEIERFNTQSPAKAKQQKFAKMSESAFVFFRGSNHLYWKDISHDWRISLFGGRPESQVWLQGDAHVYNFGALHDHEDRIYYGMDDFDDAVVADYQYDLWRLATSMVLDLSEQTYYTEDLADEAVKQLGKSYLKSVINSAQHNPSARLEFAPEPIKQFLEKTHAKNTRLKMLGKWTDENYSRFDLSNDKLEAIKPKLRKKIDAALQNYQQTRPTTNNTSDFEILDVAARTKAGTGSLGSQRFYALIGGEKAAENIILDIKQQQQPASVAVMPPAEQNWYTETFTHEGHRHAMAYNAIAEHPDAWLGWLTVDDVPFSVRERSPFKKDFPTSKLSAEQYLHMASVWGEILGREHARGSSNIQTESNAFIRFIRQHVQPERKAFIRLLRAVALNYSRCVKNDWQVFRHHFTE